MYKTDHNASMYYPPCNWDHTSVWKSHVTICQSVAVLVVSIATETHNVNYMFSSYIKEIIYNVSKFWWILHPLSVSKTLKPSDAFHFVRFKSVWFLSNSLRNRADTLYRGQSQLGPRSKMYVGSQCFSFMIVPHHAGVAQ